MIYGNIVEEIKKAHANGLFSYYIDYNEDAVDESTGRFKGETAKGKPINIMYGGGEVAHPNKIRFKVGPNSNFKSGECSEIAINYDTKELEYKSDNRMTNYERDFVLGFISRYDDLFYGISHKDYDMDASTKSIDNDMANNFRKGKTRYNNPTGKVDVSGSKNSVELSDSKNEPSKYVIIN